MNWSSYFLGVATVFAVSILALSVLFIRALVLGVREHCTCPRHTARREAQTLNTLPEDWSA